MPQSGPDLVSAGYPISNALTALLGGTGNGAAPNTPVYSNLYFGGGNTSDVAGPGSAASGSVNTIAVPVPAGAIISKMSLVAGAATSACVTNLWGALYTGTGSAPGTTGAQPALIASAASPSSLSSSSLVTFTFSSPQTISAVQAPFGYIYAAYSITTGAGSPNGLGFSVVSMNWAAAAQFPWFSTSPFSLYMTSNGGTGASVPANIGTATRAANPPVVLLY